MRIEWVGTGECKRAQKETVCDRIYEKGNQPQSTRRHREDSLLGALCASVLSFILDGDYF